MSKHSHSFHTNTQVSHSSSFFDIAPSSEFFWTKKAIEDDTRDLSGSPIIIENEFRIRNKKFFSEWETGILILRGRYLIFKKKKKPKLIEYVDFEQSMYRLEIITPTHKRYFSKYPHGFSLYANGKSVELYCKDKDQIFNWFYYLRKQCILTNFHDNYHVTEVIGSGGYGKVNILESVLDDSRFAGKFIKLSSTTNRDRQRVMIINEIRMLRKLDHSQIVKLFEVYEMAGQICLVMELVVGEKLFKYITGRKLLSEETTAYIVKQMLLILTYLKSFDIIHRDIKSENILYTLDEKGKVKLKLIDFGLGTYNKKRDIIKKCGTAGYVAPEILNSHPYNFKADLYSLGVIMYICLIGRPAFYAKNYDELLEKNKRGIVKYKGTNWSKLSPEAQDLVQRILDPNPATRISLSEALSHEWLYKAIPLEDRKDLSQYMFTATKVNIPQEKNISKIPTSNGQIPYIDKPQSLSYQTIGSYQKLHSPIQSFLTSKLALGLEDLKDLNSFYKPMSIDVSCNSQLSLNGSYTSLSRSPGPSPNFAGQQLTIHPGGRSMTTTMVPQLPRTAHRTTQHISTKALPNRYQSMKSEKGPSEPSKLNKGYSIQISGAVSLDDAELEVDDEGSLCVRYETLLRNSLHFSRITGRKMHDDSLDELRVTTQPVQTVGFDTDMDMDTPRMKYKVAAVSQGLRDQIQFSVQELFI